MGKTINGHTREEAMSLAFRMGFESEKNRMSCSQSSFHAITAALGYRNNQVFKSLLGLQGGGASSGLNACGAFNGGLVAFGLFFGRDYDLWQQGKMDLTASRLGERLLDRFHEHYQSALCKDIQMKCLGFTTRFVKNGQRDQAAFDKFEAAGGHSIVAPTIVGRAASWAIDIIWDELPPDMDLAGIPTMEEAERALAQVQRRC